MSAVRRSSTFVKPQPMLRDGPQPRATRALGGAKLTNTAAKEAQTDEQRKPPQPSPPAGGAPTTFAPRPTYHDSFARKDQRRVVVILAKAGLKVGHYGLVDAYDRSATTDAPAEPHLVEFRPDIVHQCMLALYDSDIAASGMLQVYIETNRGKTIELSPKLRPPRTYGRFKGLMEKLLNEGSVATADGQWLMRTTRWSIAPQIPYGAEVFGVHNLESIPVVSAIQLARAAVAEPVSDALQGGVKNAYAFYVISCTDDSSLDGLDYVTQHVCLNKYPGTSHVACARLCEGFRVALSKQTNTETTKQEAAADAAMALQTPGLGQKRLRV